MKAGRVLSLLTACALLATVSAAAGATPQAGPCGPGAAYDPACDVNHDNTINITDIQLTAGHWNQGGTWVGDNQHDHLGQVWMGPNALKLSGAVPAPDNAPLVLSNTGQYGLRVASASHAGVSVGPADYGVMVDAATYSGLFVDVAGHEGVYIDAAGQDGVLIYSAGNPSDVHSSASYNGFEVKGAEGSGLYVGRADEDGVHISSTGDDGLHLGEDGVSLPYGLFVPAPGTIYTTLLPNTANANGEWALHTADKIRAANVALDAQTLVAVVGGDRPLAAGDVVSALGLAEALPGSLERLAVVGLAGGEAANVVGVVSSRMALQPLPGKGGQEELHSVAGPAQPGDTVAITVLGVAQVQVEQGAALQPGQRLVAAATPGHARALRTVQVAGVRVDESGPTLGVALETVEDSMVWALVNPQ